MKKIFVIVISGILCVLALVGGVSVLSADASSRPSDNVTQPGVNFNFLANPQIMAVCQNFVYVVESQFPRYYLHIINRNNTQTQSRIRMHARPLDVIYSRDNIFIFFAEGFMVHRAVNIRANNFEFDNNPILIQYTQGTPSPMSVFNVVALSATNFNILFAHDTRHGSLNITVPISGIPGIPTQHSIVTTNRVILGIASTTSGTTYLLASPSAWNTAFFYIQNLNGENLSPRFVNPSSLNILEGPSSTTFILIANARIVYFHLETGSFYEIGPRPNDDFLTRESYDPIYIRARSTTEIFVIDRRKRSIDQYRITPGHTLAFQQTVVASIGDDYGFFNHPTSIVLVEENNFWVSDFSSAIRLINPNQAPSYDDHFITYDDNLSVVHAMAFNNSDTVYVVDRDRRIQRFNVNGTRVGLPITLPQQAEITQLVPNIATGEMFAIDAGRNNVFRIGATSVTPLALGLTTLNHTSRALINPWVDENRDIMILTNTNQGDIVVCITNNQIIQNVTTQFELTLGGDTLPLRDITMDTLGNVIAMYEDTRPLSPTFQNAIIRHFEVSIVGTTVVLIPDNAITLTNSSISMNNPSLVFDRLNNKLIWLGRFHNIEAVYLQDVNAIWSFRENFTSGAMRPHYYWEEVTPIELPTSPLFGRIRANQSPFIFEFPNSLNAQTRLNGGFEFQILQNTSTFDGVEFDYSFILFQNRTTRNHYTGYVNNRFVEHLTDYYITTNIWEDTDDWPNADNIGRVILNGVPIFKYPTSILLDPESTVFDMTIGTLNKTPRHVAGAGIRINRRITIRDIRDWEFFEIRLDKHANGTVTPNPVGAYVGYVFVQHIINFNLPQSRDNLSENATVVLPSNLQPTGIPVFHDAGGVNRIEGEYIGHRQDIEVIGRFDRSRPLTFVRYFCEEAGVTKYGYIWTRYIVMHGLTALQLTGIILAIVGTIAAVSFAIWHFKRKRNQS